MHAYRSLTASLFVTIIVAAAFLAASGSAVAQLPLEPARDSGQGITGAFEGWYSNSDGTYTLLVGYYNRNQKDILDIPVGPDNRIEPGGPDQGQPTHFMPRRHWGVFTITVPKEFGDKKLTWTIVANGQTTVIPLSLHKAWAVEPFKDAAMGNTPPVARLEQGGAAYQGPPRGIAAYYTAKAQDPLPLTMWTTDDGYQSPLSRLPASVSVSWTKFRGPGTVTFANARPPVDKADGKASTTAAFSAPGEYILRGQINDGTGDGGGGFQCCWTNVHVKVAVGPAAASK